MFGSRRFLAYTREQLQSPLAAADALAQHLTRQVTGQYVLAQHPAGAQLANQRKHRSDQERVEPNPEKHPTAQQVEIGAMKAGDKTDHLGDIRGCKSVNGAGDVGPGDEHDDKPEQELGVVEMLSPPVEEMPQRRLPVAGDQQDQLSDWVEFLPG